MTIILDPCVLVNTQDQNAILTSGILKNLINTERNGNNPFVFLYPGIYTYDDTEYDLPYMIIERNAEKDTGQFRYEIVDPTALGENNNYYKSLGTLRYDHDTNLVFHPSKKNKPYREVRIQEIPDDADFDEIMRDATETYDIKQKMDHLHPKAPQLFSLPDETLIVSMERSLFGKTLFELLKEQDSLMDEEKLNLSDLLYLMKSMTDALQEVHHKGITHGKVKLDNFIIIPSTNTDNEEIHMIGFDFAKAYGKSHITQKSDIFSLGKIIITLLTGEMPVPNQVDFSKLQSNADLPQICKEILLPLLASMTNADRKQRPNIDQVKKSIDKVCDLYFLDLFLDVFPKVIEQNPNAIQFQPNEYFSIELPYWLIKRESSKNHGEIRWEVVEPQASINNNQSKIYHSVGAIRYENGRWIFNPKSSNKRQCKTQHTPLTIEDVNNRVKAETAVGQTHLKKPVIYSAPTSTSPTSTLITISRFLPGNDLLSTINANNQLQDNEKYIRNCFDLIFQLIDATKTVHNANVVHKDIKPENIIHDKNEQTCTLIDYEFASIADVPGKKKCGTPGYAAPEAYGDNALTKASDIYSLALTIAALLGMNKAHIPLIKQMEFARNPIFKKLSKTLCGVLPEDLITEIQATLRAMTVLNPNQRISLEQAQFKFEEIKRAYDNGLKNNQAQPMAVTVNTSTTSSHDENKENKKRKGNPNSFFDSPSKKNKVNNRSIVKNRLVQHASC